MKTSYAIKKSTLIVDKENWMGIKLDFENQVLNTVLVVIKNRGWDDYEDISKELNVHKDKWIKNIKCGVNDDIIVYDIFTESNRVLFTLHTYETEMNDIDNIEYTNKMDDYLTYDICIKDYGKENYHYDYEMVVENYCHTLIESISVKYKSIRG